MDLLFAALVLLFIPFLPSGMMGKNRVDTRSSLLAYMQDTGFIYPETISKFGPNWERLMKDLIDLGIVEYKYYGNKGLQFRITRWRIYQ